MGYLFKDVSYFGLDILFAILLKLITNHSYAQVTMACNSVEYAFGHPHTNGPRGSDQLSYICLPHTPHRQGKKVKHNKSRYQLQAGGWRFQLQSTDRLKFTPYEKEKRFSKKTNKLLW